jgi:hypothetical protein
MPPTIHAVSVLPAPACPRVSLPLIGRSPWVGWILLAAVCVFGSGCRTAKQPFFPIGIYAVPKADLSKVRDAGFNLVAGSATQEYLDSAQQLGLRVLANPGTSAGNDFQAERARRTVARFDSHPTVWAWYLVDEPDLNGVPPDQVKQAHRFLKNLGAQKPTALVLYQGGEALTYANIADITMVDRYPIPWLPLANFPQHVRMARLALGQDKPLIAVVQAFDWSYYPKLLSSQTSLRPPTYDELRCMTYCALARRANGLFYYCFSDSAWKILDHAEVWNSLRSVVAELNQRMPLLTAEHIWWPYIHQFPDKNAGFNSALESSVIPALLRVKSGNSTVPRGDYLLAVNNTEKELTYRITLPQGNRDLVPVLSENRSVTVQGNWLEDKFSPYSVHIYGPMP